MSYCLRPYHPPTLISMHHQTRPCACARAPVGHAAPASTHTGAPSAYDGRGGRGQWAVWGGMGVAGGRSTAFRFLGALCLLPAGSYRHPAAAAVPNPTVGLG